MSEYISTNSGIYQQFRVYYKGGKASQLWVSSCSAQLQWVASGTEIRILVTATLGLTFFIKSR